MIVSSSPAAFAAGSHFRTFSTTVSGHLALRLDLPTESTFKPTQIKTIIHELMVVSIKFPDNLLLSDTDTVFICHHGSCRLRPWCLLSELPIHANKASQFFFSLSFLDCQFITLIVFSADPIDNLSSLFPGKVEILNTLDAFKR